MNKMPTFKEFWDAYGVKRDRMAAERAWNRLSSKDRRAAFSGIAAYRDDCARNGIRMMYGQGYITHRRWEDEPDGDAAPVQKGMPADAVMEPADDTPEEMDIW